MLIRKISLLLFICLTSACTTMKYNGASTYVKEVNYPSVGEEITAYVGEHLLKRGSIIESGVLMVTERVDGFAYEIPVGKYPQTGADEKNDYFMATGVEKAALSDPYQGLSVKKNETSEICVISVFSATTCYDAKFKLETQLSESGNSFQQTLIYSGKIGNKINISYREFSNNLARPAFNNNVEYDLSESNIIGYKGAELEIIKADNRSITYKVIRNFPNTDL